MAADPSRARLDGIRHLVVLMMENRSFDQMLGYLKGDGMDDVDGLTGDEVNHDADGRPYQVHPFKPGETAFHLPGKPLDKTLDPCHSPDCVAVQLSEGNGGFVKSFASKDPQPPREHWGQVMGYYTGKHLPVYDHLAREYCVCDAWHSSIPGDTWPNRLYSLAGRAARSIGHTPGLRRRILSLLRVVPLLKGLADAPIFEVDAFTHHLADRQWRWYSHDPATLRAADGAYRDFRLGHLNRDNFAYFDRKRVSWLTEAAEAGIVSPDSFLDDAAKGQLRDVSWIDPNFIDLHVLDPNSNDDHPPSDVRAGQALVLDVYEALLNSGEWEDTVLVVVYDEHGGFFDHAPPPSVDDGSGFQTYGVRVPALVVGPRVRKFVCHELFDHTALIKTILLRFAADPEAAIRQMGRRVQSAQHLGVLLEDEPRTDISDHGDAREEVETWRKEARDRRQVPDAQRPAEASDGAGQPLVLHDFQEEFVKFALAMRESGLPAGQP